MNKLLKKQWVFWGVLVISITFLVRFWDLGNTSFVADEFLDMNSSYGYAQTGQWQSWDFNYGAPATQNMNEARDERAVLYKHQVAFIFEFLSPTEEHARLVSVLWGVVSVLAVMFAAWFFTGSLRVALVAGALFSVAVSSIIFDRRLRMYAQFYPLYLLTSVFVFATLEKSYQGKNRCLEWLHNKLGYHPWYGLAALLFAALSFLTHQLTGTLVFVLVAYLTFQAFSAWKEEGQWNTKYTRLMVLLFLLLVALRIGVSSFVTSFTSGLIWLDNHYGYWGHFWSDFQHPLLGLLAVIFGVFVLRQERSKEAQFLCLSAFVPLILAIWFWRRNVGPQYIFMAQSFLLILAATGVRGFVKVLEREFSAKCKQYAFSAAAFLGILLLPHYRKLFTLFNEQREGFDVLVTRNFRNYYFAGAKIPVYDFGGELSEQKLQKSELEKLKVDYAHGAAVLSKNDFDYISKDAENFLESDSFEKVSHSTIRGGNAMYQW
jgi:hypothetical protein